jgi:hydrogenase maturation protein HypF
MDPKHTKIFNRVPDGESIRALIILEGVVQGVGYRPFIHRLAQELGLSGYVLNSSKGLLIEVEGNTENVEAFIESAMTTSPPLAVVRDSAVELLEPKGYRGFEIRQSEKIDTEFTLVSPDISVCDDCLRELFNPDDRRFRYPFINCTNCGPRFSIIEDTPYDRPLTTMAEFKMCDDCSREYSDLSDRRYHAQPDACGVCGPHILLKDHDGPVDCSDAARKSSGLLLDGRILTVKGIGGIHLMCNASDSEAVEKVRQIKQRARKPLALMCKSVERTREFCEVNEREQALLESPERPIVLLKKLETPQISQLVAPGNAYLGVMLPYSPLHYLLLDDERLVAIVATSANIADEPIARDEGELHLSVKKMADYFLDHNRPIYNRCDDSVVEVVGKATVMMRRSRGYAPLSMRIPGNAKQVMALGAEERNSVCLTKDGWAYLSQHVGDLKSAEAFEFFLEALERLKKIFKIEPELVVHDMHPEFLNTKYARHLKIPLLPVQHHHAHIASCMAENAITDKVIGIALDGTGYGTDGHIWGGEFMVADLTSFERVAHLAYTPMPGADLAVKEPQRMAASFLYSAYGDDIFDLDLDVLKRTGEEKLKLIVQMIKQNVNSPLSSGCGRLFDAVASLLGVCDKISYEAQGPIELEVISDAKEKTLYNYDFQTEDDTMIIGPGQIFRGVVNDIKNGVTPAVISGRFHNTVVDFSVETAKRIREKDRLDKVALSGGVFQNRLLLEKMLQRLENESFRVYINSNVPPNDGGISFGQAAIGLNISR